MKRNQLRTTEVEFGSSLSWVPPPSPPRRSLFMLVVLLVLLNCFGAISLTENNKQSSLYILILHKVCVCQTIRLPPSQMAVWCEDILSFMSLSLIKAKQTNWICSLNRMPLLCVDLTKDLHTLHFYCTCLVWTRTRFSVVSVMGMGHYYYNILCIFSVGGC